MVLKAGASGAGQPPQPSQQPKDNRQASYLGRAWGYLSSCCTRKVVYTAMCISSLALLSTYLYNQYSKDPKEEPSVEWREGSGLVCKKEGEEIYCFQEGGLNSMINFDFFISGIEGAIKVVKSCPESNAVLKEVGSSDALLVFKSNLPYHGMEASALGKSISVDPVLLEDENLAGRLVLHLLRLSGDVRENLVTLSHTVCSMGKERFLQAVQGIDDQVIGEYREIAAQCFASGSWGSHLKNQVLGPCDNEAVQANLARQYDALC